MLSWPIPSCRSYLAVLLAIALPLPLAALEVTLAEEGGGDSYRVGGALLAPAAALASGEARIVFDWTDEDNHYYVRLHQETAQIFLVKEGRTTAISRPGGIRRTQPPARLEVSLQRHDWSIQFACNKAVCARAEDRSLEPGAVGHAEGSGLSFEDFEVQSTEPIYLADDFMRTDEQLGQWSALLGQWENNQQGSKTTRSANAFSFRSVGEEPSLAVTGYPFWTDYVAQAAVRCDGSGAIGLAVGVLGAEDHYRLRWTSVHHPDGGTCRLQRVLDGQVVDLGPVVPGGFREQVWYKLQVALSGGRLLAWIDDRPLFEVAVQSFGEGQVGLWTEPGAIDTDQTAGALFDDVVVRSWSLFADDFDRPGLERWEAAGAGWEVAAGAAAPAGESRLLTRADWQDVNLEATLSATGPAGLVLHDSPAGRYLLRLAPDGLAMVRVTGGNETPLDQAPALPPAASRRLSFSFDRGLLRASVDHEPVLEAFDLSLPPGRAGLWSGVAGSRFSRVKATFEPASWTLPPSLPADFVSDQYMVTWASPGAAWIQVEGSPAKWHKGFFYGDRRMTFRLPGFGRQAGSVQLVLGAGGTDAQGAWRLELTLPAQGRQLLARLFHGEQPVAEARPEVSSDEPELSFELRGHFILLWVDGENVLQHGVRESS